MPIGLGGGQFELLGNYGVGYSAILFGLIMLISMSGDRYMKVYGCDFPKILLPFGYLILSSMIAPNADWIGHLCGIFAAVILRFGGFYQLRLLP